MEDDTVVPISKRRIEFLVVHKFALEKTNRQLRKQNRLQRDLLRSALLELARLHDKEPVKFRRQWVAERSDDGSSYL